MSMVDRRCTKMVRWFGGLMLLCFFSFLICMDSFIQFDDGDNSGYSGVSIDLRLKKNEE